MSLASTHVKALDRRADHLAKRIAAAGNGKLTFDESELAALRWVIGRISQLHRLCRFCCSDSTAVVAGEHVCDECLEERGIDR
jgi:hypothetical protein